MADPDRSWKKSIALSFVIVAVAVFAVSGLWAECRKGEKLQKHLRDGMTCLLGKRPVPRDQIRARLDLVAAAAKSKGRVNWPAVCAQFFDEAAFAATGGIRGQFRGVADEVERGNLDEIAKSLDWLYEHQDWSQP